MAIIPEDYVERLYAGWLSKLVGIRLGGDIEGSTYHELKQRFGEIDGYPLPVAGFAADDDSNGPMIFIRALNDYTHTRALTAEQIGRTWLNYVPYEHGFFWWGGYGHSTEHTAYLNLYNGIPAPRSGSIAQNGPAVAEQIGGQIFIDAWGLVLPGQPALAAEYAAKAASVSHDGEGVYGGMYVAAEIALAFTAKSVREIVLGALDFIPRDCEYARAVRDVVRFYDGQSVKDWREAFLYVEQAWGYHRYPGVCHIIPNAAVMVLALMYGEGDYDRTMNICTMCGWDTDCNAGNVGTIMGVFKGVDAISYEKWLAPIGDTFAVSCTLGCLNRMDVSWCCAYLADLAYRMAGEPMPEKWRALSPRRGAFPFAIEGATHGFAVSDGGAAALRAGGAWKDAALLPAHLPGAAGLQGRSVYPGDVAGDLAGTGFPGAAHGGRPGLGPRLRGGLLHRGDGVRPGRGAGRAARGGGCGAADGRARVRRGGRAAHGRGDGKAVGRAV